MIEDSPILAALRLVGLSVFVGLYAALALYGWLENRRNARQSQANQEDRHRRFLGFLASVRSARYR
jgi:CHASE3 domain sensor protein